MVERKPTERSEEASGWPFGIVGKSSRLRAALRDARAIAPSPLPVLLLGETGTGKELFARAIHAESGRPGPFVPVNVGGVPPEIADSELFGHERGAYTGAYEDRPGAFRHADGGTLLLDEIGEAHPRTQVKLLRALETGKIKPVGTTERIPVDVRIVAATNRDVEEGLRTGRVRKDLLGRLAAVTIELPPLRKRGGDDDLLIRHFLDGHPIKPRALELLLRNSWDDFNVRGLENEVKAAKWKARGKPIGPEHLSRTIVRAEDAGPAEEDDGWPTLEDVKREHVLDTYERCDRNQTRAAEALGIHRTTLARMLNEYGVEGEDDNEDEEG